MKNISILGSTGSIGTQTLDVISYFPDKFRVVGLSAGNNIDLLAKQATQFRPDMVSIKSESNIGQLKSKLNDDNIDIFFGEQGASNVASHPDADLVVSAMVGASGLKPTIAAIKAGKDIALANKETLVMAGKLITEEAKNRDGGQGVANLVDQGADVGGLVFNRHDDGNLRGTAIQRT